MIPKKKYRDKVRKRLEIVQQLFADRGRVETMLRSLVSSPQLACPGLFRSAFVEITAKPVFLSLISFTPDVSCSILVRVEKRMQ